MAATSPREAEQRVLVVAPVGRDAQVTCGLLRGFGVVAEARASLAALAAELPAGAGAILITTEALATEGAGALTRALSAQEPWSDLPVIFAADHGDARPPPEGVLAPAGRVTVTVLERPIRVVTLRTIVQAALQARTRQYQLRDLLDELRRHVRRLDAERVIRDRFVVQARTWVTFWTRDMGDSSLRLQ